MTSLPAGISVKLCVSWVVPIGDDWLSDRSNLTRMTAHVASFDCRGFWKVRSALLKYIEHGQISVDRVEQLRDVYLQWVVVGHGHFLVVVSWSAVALSYQP